MKKSEFHAALDRVTYEDFLRCIGELRELHDNKNADYGTREDPFANFRMSSQCGIPPWVGAVVRMGDKYSRLCKFARYREFKVKEETVEDTFKDMAVYSIIGMLLYFQRSSIEIIPPSLDNPIPGEPTPPEMHGDNKQVRDGY